MEAAAFIGKYVAFDAKPNTRPACIRSASTVRHVGEVIGAKPGPVDQRSGIPSFTLTVRGKQSGRIAEVDMVSQYAQTFTLYIDALTDSKT